MIKQHSSFCLLSVAALVLGMLEGSFDPHPLEGQEPQAKLYLETFEHGNGGWYADRGYALPVWDGVAYCYGPWFLDANHAPPGAGYLNLLMWLYTSGKWYEVPEASRLPYTNNSFLEQGFGTNFTNAKFTVRLRGNVDLKGTQLLLLAQAESTKTTSNYVLSGQPFEITNDWSEQTVTLLPDPAQWTCMGARHDAPHYGCDDIDIVLNDLNVDLIFVLFPVKVVPLDEEITDLHGRWAGKDYSVDTQYHPKGLLMFDTVKIEFPQ